MGVDKEGEGGGAAPDGGSEPGNASKKAEDNASAKATAPKEKSKPAAKPERAAKESKRNAGAASLPVHAKPFVPSTGTTAASKGSSGLRNIAEPFVPSQKPAGNAQQQASKKSFSSSAAKAVPFVPGALGTASSGASSSTSATMSSSAAPFVPRPPPSAGAQSPASKASQTQAAQQSPGNAGRGSKARGSAANTGPKAQHKPDAPHQRQRSSDTAASAGPSQHGSIPPGGAHPGWPGYWNADGGAAPNMYGQPGNYGGMFPGAPPNQGPLWPPHGPPPHPANAPWQMPMMPYGGAGPSHGSVVGGQSHQQAQGWMSDFMNHLPHQSSQIHAQVAPEEETPGIPLMMEEYHSVVPLEDPGTAGERISAVLGEASLVLKAISNRDGVPYALRRIAKEPTSEFMQAAVQAERTWKAVPPHPVLLPPLAVFPTHEFWGEAALVFVHSYCPDAETLEDAHLKPRQSSSGVMERKDVKEQQLWSYLVQLASAVRVVHGAGLVFHGSITPSKLLVTPNGRLRCGSLGVMEALHGAEVSDQEEWASLQQDDLAGIGHTLLQVACGPLHTITLEACGSLFSPELTGILGALTNHGHGQGITSVGQLLAMLGPEVMMQQLDTQMAFNQQLEKQLTREYDNGRLFRLAARLATVVDRDVGDGVDHHWSDTGDRYLLKLFYDFIFHQVSESGAPIIDWAHMVESLNKLDAGLPEQIILLSRDESAMLVVSYADLKRCLEGAFQDLQKKAAKPSYSHHHQGYLSYA